MVAQLGCRTARFHAVRFLPLVRAQSAKRLNRTHAPVKTIVKATALAAIPASTTFGAVNAADVVVTFNPADVAYGYTDGYWTTKREWRTWDKPEYVEVYRKHPGARYYDYRHDRDPDKGWRGDIVITR